MENDLSDFRARLNQLMTIMRTQTRAQIAALSEADAHDLFVRAVIATGKLPTLGEMITWIGRRAVKLASLRARLDDESAKLSDRLDYEKIHTFWTEERLYVLPETPRRHIQAILDRPVETYRTNLGEWQMERVTRVIYALGADDLYNAWRDHAKLISKRFLPEQTELCRTIIREAKLDKVDEDRMLDDLKDAVEGEPSRPYGYIRFYDENTFAYNALLTVLGVHEQYGRKNVISICVGEKYNLTFEQAIAELQKHPVSTIETALERALVRVRAHLTTTLASTAEIDNIVCLLDGALPILTHENPFVREALFRFLVDEMGFNPRTEAAFVTNKREVRYAGRGYEGTWHLYPVPARGYTLMFGIDIYNFGYLRVFKGELEAAKACLAEDMNAVASKHANADWRRLRRELDPAGPEVSKNMIKAHPQIFVESRIAEQLALREHIQEQLRQL